MSAKEETRGMDGERGRALVEAAREGIARAYAPYSEYRVGAALLTADDSIVTGVNVENASYGLSVCAERTAVFAARARGLVDPRSSPLRAIAIHSPGPAMPWPCGACRQVLREFAGPSVPVLIDGSEGTVEMTLGELLPRAFHLEGR
jgi:cytidine deaminase